MHENHVGSDLDEAAIAFFAVAQLLLTRLLLGQVITDAYPRLDFGLGVQHRHRSGGEIPIRAIASHDPVFNFVKSIIGWMALALDGSAPAFAEMLPVIRVNRIHPTP